MVFVQRSLTRITQTLARAYNLAIEHERLSHRPTIRHLSEKGNERKGFFESAECRAVIENLPEDLQDFARCAYLTGWRKGEIRSLLWE
jgi:integrase